MPEMLDYLNASSLNFLSYEGLIRAVGVPEDQLCMSCFNGDYPIDIGPQKQAIRYFS